MKNLIRTVLLSCVLATPAMAQKIPLSELSAYLNTLTSDKARFTQTNDDGSRSTGTVYIKRPGRARFEYDPPNKGLVIAGGSQVAIFDAKSNLPPEQYPLRRTPLSLVLARNVDLAKSASVVGHGRDGKTTRLKMQDPKHPEYGNIELLFSDQPVRLRGWIINNEAGGQVTVELEELQRVDLGSNMFSITFEVSNRGLD
ncbi:MAG: outer membrane lipoprotein carrier protein LolA [Litoreibacter sp.]|nr:outer membrane lipoprotein carrier protein LolA [Litoreibacter sp.]